MRVDVVEVLGFDLRVLQCELDGLGGRFASLVRGHLVEGIAREREAQHFAIDPRAAVDGVIDRLQHQCSGTLAGHETIAIAVKGPACFFGRVIARGEGANRIER